MRTSSAGVVWELSQIVFNFCGGSVIFNETNALRVVRLKSLGDNRLLDEARLFDSDLRL